MIIIVYKANLKIPSKNKEIKDCEWQDFKIDSKAYGMSSLMLAIDPSAGLIKILKDRFDAFGKFEKGSDLLKIIESYYNLENVHLGKNDRKIH